MDILNSLIFIISYLLTINFVSSTLDLTVKRPVLEQSFYDNFLNAELCSEQLSYMETNTRLRARFLDAGIRTPRGLLDGNFVDLGNYFQCLKIYEDIGDSAVEGKYCSISIPLEQENLEVPSLPQLPEWPESWPEIPWPILNPNNTLIDEEVIQKYRVYDRQKSVANALAGSRDSLLSSISLTVAVCIPKVCTTQQALDRLLLNTTSLGLEYRDNYCRLPGDKQWVPADYVAIAVFGLIGLLTILSTAYDVHYSVLLKRDPKKMNGVFQSFSVYTNTRKLVTYTTNPRVLECLDGIRVIAIVWIIAGHTYSTHLQVNLVNPIDIVSWMGSLHSIWITAAPVSVDTFFMISGVLLVYTTAGKMSGVSFLKRVHLFYLNRLLRMFPLLAACVLLQASFFVRVADGPNWTPAITPTQNCRTYWWSTLLHVQNYVNPMRMCLSHSWYLAVDTQLHILSPLVIYWVMVGRKSAWAALVTALTVFLVGATCYNAFKGFRSALVNAGELVDTSDYLSNYYTNTLTRAAPFLVGMLFGYLLYSVRGTKVRLSRATVALLWILSAAVMILTAYVHHPTQQADWDHDVLDIIINSFMRAAWAAAVGWLIFACVHGYGGPIAWVLSLQMWKVPSRISYAMYIFHYQLMFIINSMSLAPVYFSDLNLLFRFFADLLLAVFVAFWATVLIDSPFSTLIKLALGGGPKARMISAKKPEIKIIDTTNTGIIKVGDYEIKTRL